MGRKPKQQVGKVEPGARSNYNISADIHLMAALDAMISKNRKLSDRSKVIEEELIRLIASKGCKYGLKVPEHLL